MCKQQFISHEQSHHPIIPSKHPHLRSTTENGLCDIFSPWPASYKHLARTSRGNEVKFQKRTDFNNLKDHLLGVFWTKIGIVWLYLVLVILLVPVPQYIYIYIIKYVCLKYVPWNTHDILHIYGKHFKFDLPVVWHGDLDYHLVGLVPSTQLHTQPVEAAGDEP